MNWLWLIGVFILGVLIAVGLCRGGKCIEKDEHEQYPGAQ